VTGDPLTDTPLLQWTTAAVLAKQVARRPDAIALVGADGTQMTYQDVRRRSDGIASGFRRLGVSRHEKVLLFLDNHLDNVLAWLGTTVGAMVSVPINSAFKGEMLAYVINESQASVIVIEGCWIERLTAIADQLPLLQTVVVRGGNGELLPGRRSSSTTRASPQQRPTAAPTTHPATNPCGNSEAVHEVEENSPYGDRLAAPGGPKSISGICASGSVGGNPWMLIGSPGPIPSGFFRCTSLIGGGGPMSGGRSTGTTPVA
jgi:acyl-CoA synthetase (AMP-forming)/AMP-acid ligase II